MIHYNKAYLKGEKTVINIEDLLSGDFSAYPEEAQEYLKNFNEKLREYLIEELVGDVTQRIFKSIEGGKEEYRTILTEILERGHKGYNNMSTRTLLNIFLEKKDEESFIKLLERVSENLG